MVHYYPDEKYEQTTKSNPDRNQLLYIALSLFVGITGAFNVFYRFNISGFRFIVYLRSFPPTATA